MLDRPFATTVAVQAGAAGAASPWRTITRHFSCVKTRGPEVVYSPEGQILRYDSERAFKWRMAAQMFFGSVLDKYIPLHAAIGCAAATGIAYVFPGELISNTNSLILQTLVAFLTGLFLSTCFNRWWATRMLLQTVMGQTSNLAVLSSALIRGETPAEEAEAAQIRADMVRYLNLAHALVYKQARNDGNADDLIEKGLVTPEEWAELRDMPARTNGAYFLAASRYSDAVRSNLVVGGPAAATAPILGAISAARGAAADIFMYVNTQVPYTYVFLMAGIVRIHILLVVLFSAHVIAEGTLAKLAFGWLFVATNVCVYEGLLKLARELENPFGTDPLDFPASVYQQATAAGSAAVLRLADHTHKRRRAQ
eukprot:tig00000204_g17774.t1